MCGSNQLWVSKHVLFSREFSFLKKSLLNDYYLNAEQEVLQEYIMKTEKRIYVQKVIKTQTNKACMYMHVFTVQRKIGQITLLFLSCSTC